MKKITNNIYRIVYSLIDIITSTVLSVIFPIADLVLNFCNNLTDILGVNLKAIENFSNLIRKNIVKTTQNSLVIYYLILVISEIYMFIKVIQGKIVYYNFSTLLIYTLIIILFSLIFVFFLNKNYKSDKFNYIIYFQILFLLPLIFVYWIANIEGHILYLKDLTSDQWISLFNTIIIYFLGCLIGLITLYKNNK